MKTLSQQRHAVCVMCDRRGPYASERTACTVDGRPIADHARAGDCPLDRFTLLPATNAPKPADAGWADVPRAHAMWADLHRTALAGQLTPEWLAAFAGRLPCGECRREWLALVKKHPLHFDQFLWSYSLHRLVSDRLNKPSPTLAESRAIWSAMTTP